MPRDARLPPATRTSVVYVTCPPRLKAGAADLTAAYGGTECVTCLSSNLANGVLSRVRLAAERVTGARLHVELRIGQRDLHLLEPARPAWMVSVVGDDVIAVGLLLDALEERTERDDVPVVLAVRVVGELLERLVHERLVRVVLLD